MSESNETKYEFTGETREVWGHTLHRIRAVRDFGYVEKGTLGGWIENESNLAHKGNCWVSEEALVYGNAMVCEHAKVYENALVYGNAFVSGDARVYGDASVFGKAWVYGKAWVHGNAHVYDKAQVYDHANVYGNAVVYDHANVYGNAVVYGTALVYGNAGVSDTATICGNAVVDGAANIMGDAKVEGIADYIVIKNSWSSGRWITYTHSNGMWKVGCFYGTGKELIEKAYKDSEEKGRFYEQTVQYVEGIERLFEKRGD